MWNSFRFEGEEGEHNSISQFIWETTVREGRQEKGEINEELLAVANLTLKRQDNSNVVKQSCAITRHGWEYDKSLERNIESKYALDMCQVQETSRLLLSHDTWNMQQSHW